MTFRARTGLKTILACALLAGAPGTSVLAQGFSQDRVGESIISLSPLGLDVADVTAGNTDGVLVADFNDDGLNDLLLYYRDNRDNQLLINGGNGGFIKDESFGQHGGMTTSASAVDIDNDGDLDLFITNAAGQDNFLYLNDGQGKMTLITEGAIVTDGGDSISAAWADFNGDKRLDLLVVNGSNQANFLYQKTPEGFVRVYGNAIVDERLSSSSATWVDIDGDKDLDLFVTNSDLSSANSLFRNDGDGYFTKIAQGDIAFDRGRSIAGHWVDLDNDGDLDLFILNDGASPFLYLNQGNGILQKLYQANLLDAEGMRALKSVQWIDVDHDGDLDMVGLEVGQPLHFYINNGDGDFTTAKTEQAGAYMTAAFAVADFNNDGQPDIYLGNHTQQEDTILTLVQSAGGYIRVKLVGTFSNAMGAGAKVSLTSGSGMDANTQVRMISPRVSGGSDVGAVVTFGLGDARRAELLSIEWPSGQESRISYVEANQSIQVIEGRGQESWLTKRFQKPIQAGNNALVSAYASGKAAGVETYWQSLPLDQRDFSKLLSMAQELSVTDFFEAQALLDYMQRVYPQSSAVPFLKADALRHQNRMLEAMAFYQQALDNLERDDLIKEGYKHYIATMAARFVQ